jgi:hypothetical protein
MANPSSAVMTEARRGDPHADHRERQPKVTGKRQPGDGLGTIRRFGNGYDRNRVNHYLRSKPRRSVNGQIEVRAGGQVKVPTPVAAQAVLSAPPVLWRASRIRCEGPSVTTTTAWCSKRSSSDTAMVSFGRKRPQSSNGQWLATARARRS